jgi:hypothetical protein
LRASAALRWPPPASKKTMVSLRMGKLPDERRDRPALVIVQRELYRKINVL